MKKLVLVLVAALFFGSLFAQNMFEGSIDVLYTNEKTTTILCEIKVKGDDVYLKQNENGNSKYDRFVINLKSRELFTISKSDKKVIIKYNFDSLVNYYSRNNLKEGFAVNPGFSFKISDKAKTENGVAMAKYTGETDLKKATVWVGESKAPINTLVPFLRLLGNWNEGDGSFKNQIFETEVTNKVSKKDSKVKVSVTTEPVAKEMFILPKTYLQKDFSKMMNEERDNKLLKTIIQTFAEF